MKGLRLEIDLDKIGENTQVLVGRTSAHGVSITGVTKAMVGDAQVARVLVASGVVALGDSRIENIERMRHAHVSSPMLLLRSPAPSEIDRIVRSSTISIDTDTDVLSSLATAARVCGRVHDVMIMVDLGDLRDGCMPSELRSVVRHVLRQPTLRLHGIGTNLACRHGTEPDDQNMSELSALVDDIEATFDVDVPTVSGGNSTSLGWLSRTESIGRVNNLRLGEAILLGRDPLDRAPIAGLHTDAITLVGEVIESRRKPTRPAGTLRRPAFGYALDAHEPEDRGEIWQTIVAAGRQDIDPDDLRSLGSAAVLSATSDHLILETPSKLAAGDEIRFEPGYSALLRAMTSPFVAKNLHQQRRDRPTIAVSSSAPSRTDAAARDRQHRPRLSIVPRSTIEPSDRSRLGSPESTATT